MKFFIDTEFIESGPTKPIQLISIGIVAEDGREFYAISSEFDPATASPWVRDNVLAKLEDPRIPLKEIALGIIAFIWPDYLDSRPMPEFWGYYADYDWVVFCQIFGTMMDLPPGFPMHCCDIKQRFDEMGTPPLPPESGDEHNALADARWNRMAFAYLSRVDAGRKGRDSATRYRVGRSIGTTIYREGDSQPCAWAPCDARLAAKIVSLLNGETEKEANA